MTTIVTFKCPIGVLLKHKLSNSLFDVAMRVYRGKGRIDYIRLQADSIAFDEKDFEPHPEQIVNEKVTFKYDIGDEVLMKNGEQTGVIAALVTNVGVNGYLVVLKDSETFAETFITEQNIDELRSRIIN